MNIDTNIIVRFVVGDDANHLNIINKEFKKKEDAGEYFLLSPLIIAESIYVLESFYKYLRSDITSAITKFLNLRIIRLDEEIVILRAIGLYDENNLSFPDCYLAAKCLVNNEELFTFDKRLRNLIRKFQTS